MHFASTSASALLLAFLVASASPSPAFAKAVLIIDQNKAVMGGLPVVSDDSLVLGGLQVAAGNTVTYSGLLLPNLTDFDQIWDIRASTPISDGLQADYLSFLQGGGALALIGENFIFKTRADTIVDLVALAGGGKLTSTGPGDGPQTVLAPFDGPFPVSTISFHSPGGFFGIGHGKGVTQSALGDYVGAAFAPGSLDNAGFGRLVVFMDTGLFNPEDNPIIGSIGAQSLTRNIIHYLGDEPAPPPGTHDGVPEPATWAMMLLGFGFIGTAARRRRRTATV